MPGFNATFPTVSVAPVTGETSAPIRCPAGTEITVSIYQAGGSCSIDFTTALAPAVFSGAATWTIGGGGAFTAGNTPSTVKVYGDCFIRVVSP